MQLNCKVIEKVGTPPPLPFLQQPPFQGLSPLFSKIFGTPQSDSIFGRSYPPSAPTPFNKWGGGSNYDYGNLTWVSKYINNFPLLLKENKLPEKGNGSI